MTQTLPGILARIVAGKRQEAAPASSTLEAWEAAAEARRAQRRDFLAALRRAAEGGAAIIAEVKKASPSRGLLTTDFDPARTAQAYQRGGAAALSVLTDGEHFHGSLRDLETARAAGSLPALRKDFTTEGWHIVQAAAHGADAILLIAAILSERELRDFRESTARFGMAALVEVHNREELAVAAASGADLIGVNNRDLSTFEVSLETSLRLAAHLPTGALAVSESGIHAAPDICEAARSGLRRLPGRRAFDEIGRPGRRRAKIGGGMIVKICGITTAEDAAAAIEAGATAIGFNFYARSPRYIAPEDAASIATPGARRVGVFVNESRARIAQIARVAGLDTVQLHGAREDAEYPQGLALWRARNVTPGFAPRGAAGRGAPNLPLGSAAAGWPGGRVVRRLPQQLRLAAGARRGHAHRDRGRPGCGQCRARRFHRAAMGRGCVLAHRALARKEGPRAHGGIYPRGAGGAGGAGEDRRMTAGAESAGRFGPYGGQLRGGNADGPHRRAGEGVARSARGYGVPGRTVSGLLRDYASPPTPLYFAKRLSEKLGGARIYLKREDLLHTGAHKINNCLGQGLLALRMGKRRMIAETGAGQHGVATATVAALLGLKCVVYMGEEDMARQGPNVFRMRMLGAEVIGVNSGSRTLKDAINEAMRDWVTNVEDTHYLLGSVLGRIPIRRWSATFTA